MKRFIISALAITFCLFIGTTVNAKETKQARKKNDKITETLVKTKKVIGDQKFVRIKNYAFSYLMTTCPDGTSMAAGVVAIRSDSSGNIIGVRTDYWGDQVACADHNTVRYA